MSDLVTWVQAHPVPTALVGVAGIVTLALVVVVARPTGRAIGRGVRSFWTRPASALTVLAAGIATIVAASGMWQFFARVMPDLAWPWRIVMFAFLEVAVITSAVRARENLREHGSARVDGVAVWVLTGLSAALSAMEATGIPEGVFRLAAPLVAAWLWERGMAVEHRRLTGRGRVNWRITPERILVWLGLAEANDRTASEVDVQRRIARVARAAHQVRQAQEGTRRHARALRRLHRRMAQAVEHAGLATSPEAARLLTAHLGALYHAPALAHVTPAAPWGSALGDVQVYKRLDVANPSHAPEDDPVQSQVTPKAPTQTDDSDMLTSGRLSVGTSDSKAGQGHDPGPGPEVSILPGGSQADLIRAAVALLEDRGDQATPASVRDVLQSQGHRVKIENIRTVLRRVRQKRKAVEAEPPAAPVFQLRPLEPAVAESEESALNGAGPNDH